MATLSSPLLGRQKAYSMFKDQNKVKLGVELTPHLMKKVTILLAKYHKLNEISGYVVTPRQILFYPTCKCQHIIRHCIGALIEEMQYA